MLLPTLLLALLAAAPAGGDAGHVPPAVTGERYTFETDPARLPPWVRTALARELGQDTLDMAAAGRPFAATDVVDPGHPLPGRRLIQAAVGERYAVVHYETGGVAHTFSVVVLGREAAAHLWSGSVRGALDRPAFQAAIKDGSLFARAARP